MKTYRSGFALSRALRFVLLVLLPVFRMAGADPAVATLRAKAEIGKSFRLSLEPYADHPELGGDQITDTLPVNPDPPFFYDVGPLGP